MAGAPATPPPIAESALVLIDCQMEYVNGRLPLTGVDAALDGAARVLALAREKGAPIVHIAHHGRPGGLFGTDGPYVEIAEQVAPAAGEEVIPKSLPNAFAGTTLDDTLKRLERKSLVVVGFMTHMCVSSTVRAALDLGYGCTVVGGACATRDLPDGHGGVVDAVALHRAELVALSDRFAIVVDAAAALEG
jgi:nicotinamidase-related amidase